MTKEDARAIFSNIAELAMFADFFSEELERALGRIVEGGEGEDYVGQVFIDVVRAFFLSLSVCVCVCTVCGSMMVRWLISWFYASTDPTNITDVHILHHPSPNRPSPPQRPHLLRLRLLITNDLPHPHPHPRPVANPRLGPPLPTHKACPAAPQVLATSGRDIGGDAGGTFG